MDGDDLKRLRERKGLERDELAALINSALGTNYAGETIARWERGRPQAKKVEAFFEELAVSELAAPALGADDTPLDPPHVDERAHSSSDTPPGPGPSPAPAQPPVLTGSPVWTKACTELWEMIATGVGMAGAATGNMALVNDGAVIAGDKDALGAAWGKLAETNETFRKMLVGMTEGGAWLQVALVTGTTLSKCYQGHVQYAAHVRQARAPQPVEVPPDGPVYGEHAEPAAVA